MSYISPRPEASDDQEIDLLSALNSLPVNGALAIVKTGNTSLSQVAIDLQGVTDRGAITDNIITLPGVKVDTTATPATSAPGLIQWNQVDGTYDMGLLNSSVLQVGQETMFFGKASGAIANGDLVQFAGVEGDHIKIKKAVGSEIDANPHFLVGVATENIANGAFGYVTWFGKVNGVYTKTPANQDDADWVAGDLLYFNVTTGQLTKTFPTVPNRVIIVAAVIKAQTGSAENGIIIVRPTFGCKVTDLDDVNGTALTADGQIMTWHNTEGYFDFDKNINDYAKLDGTNQPFTGDLNVSKTAPEYKLTDTNKTRLKRVATVNQANLYNEVSVLANEGTGGNITRSGGYTIHTFLTGGTFTAPLGGLTAKVLVVAGGGGGGAGVSSQSIGAGGGGAGGLVYDSAYSISAGSYTITVGAGGKGTTLTAGTPNDDGTNGGNSIFNTITATGGGRGGTYWPPSFKLPQNGGCGGGGIYPGYTGGTGSQGYNGGAGGASGNFGGAGGGGMGSAGVDVTADNGTNGGDGVVNPLTGSGYVCGGGGGGYGSGGTTGGTGGNGVGGNGQSSGVSPTVGSVNTGSGGGGGGFVNSNGADGGSGIIIISYPTPATSVQESTLIDSRNSDISGEKGVNSFGDPAGATVVRGASVVTSIGSTEKMRVASNGNVGIGTTAPSAKTHIVSTTEQLRLGYDVSNYLSATVASNNTVTLANAVAADININCGTDKTLVLGESVWDDIQFNISSGRTAAANFPDWDTSFTTNTAEYKFDVDDYIDLGANEMAHWWKEGTAVYPHIHVALDGANSSGSSQYVKFILYIAYADANEVWTETTFTAEKEIPTGTADLTHLLITNGSTALANNLIGTQVKIRLKRIAATTGTEYPNHIFVTQVGLHAEADTIGSRTISAK